ncbi:MAG TPA: hypothetical protein VK788_27655 [Terriglobales bacterium]|jgi:hypothetical protein|nr:hypothetical protein [Terriglobales bacterium]
MKNMFLLIVVPVLLVALGFGQAPAPSSNTDQASIKGCLGGSDGNYTLAEDDTTQTFQVTSSTVDLSAHVGHDVDVIGQKANADTSSGASDNSVVVTGVNMISNQCATTAAATAGTPIVADPTPTATADSPAVTASTPVATASTPPASDQIPTATADSPAVTDSTPTATASSPAATDQTPAATASTPAAADPTPTASASAPENNDQLPATATPLPLLGLLGLGLLATGLLSWKSRTN